MVRIIIAAVLGAVVYFAWGITSWMVLDWHNPTMTPMAENSAVVTAIGRQVKEPGMYYFPPRPADWSEPGQWEAYTELHEAGPAGFMVVSTDPGPPMPPMMMIQGGVLNLIVMLLVGWLLAMASMKGYLKRVIFVAVIGAVVGLTADGGYWNWMGMPTHYSVVMAADRVIGFLLAGIFMAALIWPKRVAATGQAGSDSTGEA